MNINGSGNANFANTASVMFVLPESTSFTSASTVFLTGLAPAGVPEPATWAMMLVGFGGLGALLRRRRASFQTA